LMFFCVCSCCRASEWLQRVFVLAGHYARKQIILWLCCKVFYRGQKNARLYSISAVFRPARPSKIATLMQGTPSSSTRPPSRIYDRRDETMLRLRHVHVLHQTLLRTFLLPKKGHWFFLLSSIVTSMMLRSSNFRQSTLMSYTQSTILNLFLDLLNKFSKDVTHLKSDNGSLKSQLTQLQQSVVTQLNTDHSASGFIVSSAGV
jgi:hypothetical protein